MGKLFIIRDTREQPGNGWMFPENELFSGTKIIKLDTGDYSIEGLEHIVTVERKGCISEFVQNLYDPRFWREIERMRDFPVAEIVLEFTMDDIINWPQSSDMSARAKKLVKTTPNGVLRRLMELRVRHPYVNFGFVGRHGKQYTASLLKRVAEYELKRRT